MTVTSVSGTLPVFVTSKVYVTVSPTVSPVRSAVLTSATAGSRIRTVADDSAERTGSSPAGGCAVATAVLSTTRAARSAAVTV